MKYPRKLAIAVRNGQIGVIYMLQDDIIDWRRTRTRRRSLGSVRRYLNKVILEFNPNVVVCESLSSAERKGERAKAILKLIESECRRLEQRHVVVLRVQEFSNKHDEAVTLCQRHPALNRLLPNRRRVQDDEPRSYVYFEAVALAEKATRCIGH